LHLQADPPEQAVLSRIQELKAAGRTTRQIAAELNRQGAPPGAARHGVSSMSRKRSGRHRWSEIQVLSAEGGG
jgi:hypothetical protein